MAPSKKTRGKDAAAKATPSSMNKQPEEMAEQV
jgi:hypothetical protein